MLQLCEESGNPNLPRLAAIMRERHARNHDRGLTPAQTPRPPKSPHYSYKPTAAATVVCASRRPPARNGLRTANPNNSAQIKFNFTCFDSSDALLYRRRPRPHWHGRRATLYPLLLHPGRRSSPYPHPRNSHIQPPRQPAEQEVREELSVQRCPWDRRTSVRY